jgi:hypothetical protein
MMTFAEKLLALDACSDAVEWAEGKTAEQAYAECKRGDRMAWLAARLFPRQRVVIALCDCVEPVLQYVPAEDERPLVAIQTARQWALGQATTEQVRAAAAAIQTAQLWARGQATTYAYAAARATADAAAYAIATSYSAARAADAAASAAAAAEDDDAANADSLRRSADIMRQHFGLEEFLAALERKK